MLGNAYQRGLVPVSADAIERAIELNGVAVEMNKSAFAWGRLAAHDPEAAEIAAAERSTQGPVQELSETLEQIIGHREKFLQKYQNRAYANRYIELVREIQKLEENAAPGKTSLAKAVAKYAFKLMAYKDEYEVARLHSDPEFRDKIRKTFEGEYKLTFHLAPPLCSQRS